MQPGWVATLTRAGRRVIALDDRGHGAIVQALRPGRVSHQPHGRGRARAAGSSRRSIVPMCMGYSMGARITAFLALAHPARVRSAILGGLGVQAGRRRRTRRKSIAEALEAPSLDDVTDPQGRTFRAFADQTKSDRRALAACIRGIAPDADARGGRQASRRRCWSRSAARMTLPARRTSSQQFMPGARAIDIPGRDHMLAVGDKVFKAAVLEFLESSGPMTGISRPQRDLHRRGRQPARRRRVRRRRPRWARRFCCCMAADRPGMPGARPRKRIARTGHVGLCARSARARRFRMVEERRL